MKVLEIRFKVTEYGRTIAERTFEQVETTEGINFLYHNICANFTKEVRRFPRRRK